MTKTLANIRIVSTRWAWYTILRRRRILVVPSGAQFTRTASLLWCITTRLARLASLCIIYIGEKSNLTRKATMIISWTVPSKSYRFAPIAFTSKTTTSKWFSNTSIHTTTCTFSSILPHQFTFLKWLIQCIGFYASR